MGDLPEQPTVWLCEECRVRVPDQDVLKAPHPFTEGDTVTACPHCREMGTLMRACAWDGCKENVCKGTPGVHGYRYAWTCDKH
jgi:hypothetical protein